MINSNLLWGSAMLTGLLASLWSQVRFMGRRLVSLMFVTVNVKGDMCRAMTAMCWQNYRRSPYGTRFFNSVFTHIGRLGRVRIVGYEMIGSDPITFWRGFRPLIVGQGQSTNNSGGGSSAPGSPRSNSDTDSLTLTFIRGMWNSDRLLVDALEFYHKDDESRFAKVIEVCKVKRFGVHYIRGPGRESDGALKHSMMTDTGLPDWRSFRLLQYTESDFYPDDSGRKVSALDSLSLPDHVLEAVARIRRWQVSEPWYKERNIPWTCGMLIYGPPGTGKTSLVRGLAVDIDVPIYVFDLASLNNWTMVDGWKKMQANAPCIALFEDIDATFVGRTNRHRGPADTPLTFDCLLNCMSGVEPSTGVIKIVTTNKIDDLDSALGVRKTDGAISISTRPGRLDWAVELAVLSEAGRWKIARRVLADCLDQAERVVNDGSGDSGAQFTERCVQLALAMKWNATESKSLEPQRSGVIGLATDTPLDNLIKHCNQSLAFRTVASYLSFRDTSKPLITCIDVIPPRRDENLELKE